MVYARIGWRCDQRGVWRVEDKTGHWWRTTQANLAEEVGLTQKQVGRAARWLIARGELEATEHRWRGIGDRTLSYRLAPPPGRSTRA